MHLAKTKFSITSTRQKIANSAKQTLNLSIDGVSPIIIISLKCSTN